MIPTLDVAALDVAGAVDALEAALRAGLDPDADPARSVLAAGRGGQLLVMPSVAAGGVGVKLATVGGDPRIQGVYVLFDADTLAPAALLDGIALTLLRTAAVSALAVRHLAPPGARRLVVFGRGPQATAHVEAIRAVLPSLADVQLVGRGGRADLRDADVVCCCTTAREPLFAAEEVGPRAVVVAIGSHEPDARELDAALLRRAAAVVVESRAAALREAGDVIMAGLGAGELVTLGELVAGAVAVGDGPRIFKSVGMAWEDLVVAGAVRRAHGPGTGGPARPA